MVYLVFKTHLKVYQVVKVMDLNLSSFNKEINNI